MGRDEPTNPKRTTVHNDANASLTTGAAGKPGGGDGDGGGDDDDDDASSVVTPSGIQCPRGSMITAGNLCAECPEGTFSIGANQLACTTARVCQGEVHTPATRTSDTVCMSDGELSVCPKPCPGAATAATAGLVGQQCIPMDEGVCTQVDLNKGVFPIEDFVRLASRRNQTIPLYL